MLVRMKGVRLTEWLIAIAAVAVVVFPPMNVRDTFYSRITFRPFWTPAIAGQELINWPLLLAIDWALLLILLVVRGRSWNQGADYT